MNIAPVSSFYKANNAQNTYFDSKVYCQNFGGLFSKRNKTETHKENKAYLSSEEYHRELKSLDKRIQKDSRLSNNKDIRDIRKNLNRFNIILFEKYIDNELFSSYNSGSNLLKGLISDTDNPDDAVRFNKLVSETNLAQNGYLLSICRIAQFDKTSKCATRYNKLTDTLFNNEYLYKSEGITNNLDKIAELTQTPQGEKIVYNVLFDEDFAGKYLKDKYKFEISEDYIKNQHNLKISKENSDMQIVTFSLNGDNYEILSDESVWWRKDSNDDISVKKDKDGNTFISVVSYDIVFDNFFPSRTPVTQKNTKYDKDGNRIYTEIKRAQKTK